MIFAKSTSRQVAEAIERDFGPAPKSWDSIARRFVEHDTTAQETFGELPVDPARLTAVGVRIAEIQKAANDDVQVAAQPARRGPPYQAVIDAREAAEKSPGIAILAEALGLNKPTAPAGLDDIRQLPGFIYLGSPYSLYKGGYDEAASVVSTAAASLMATGLCIYAPITHGHFISGHGDLPQTWAFWKAQCQPMIDAASALIVLQMDGWDESVGLTYEIEEFGIAGKPVVYLEQTGGGRVA